MAAVDIAISITPTYALKGALVPVTSNAGEVEARWELTGKIVSLYAGDIEIAPVNETANDVEPRE